MKYISTRGQAPALSFEDAMLTGLARDGGLYVPEAIPQLSHAEIKAMAGKSYEEIAFQVMRPFVGETFSDDDFKGIIERAYAGFGHAARAPLVQLDQGHYLLELFHGPTLAFKDFAMQLIGQLFQTALSRRNERVTIVGATSGDTGSAAIEALACASISSSSDLETGAASEAAAAAAAASSDRHRFDSEAEAIAREGTSR